MLMKSAIASPLTEQDRKEEEEAEEEEDKINDDDDDDDGGGIGNQHQSKVNSYT